MKKRKAKSFVFYSDTIMNSLAGDDISTKSSSHKVKWNTTTYQVKQEHDFQILRIWQKKRK